MLKKLSVTCFLFFCVIQIKAQDLVSTTILEPKSTEANNTLYLIKNYPEGVYKTFDDFLEKKFIYMGDALERRNIVGSRKSIEKDAVVDHAFFYWKKNDVRITDYFAISYNGSLYIQQRYFEKFASKEDHNMSGDNPNSYHRVLNDGKFLYLEGPFANGWSKAFAYGSGGAVGGVIGANLNTLKGIIFDVDKKEFNFIRECNDLNLLIEKYNGTQIDCKDKKIDILSVRENIVKIIQ
ncbi:hypothetical protein [Flavobacterium aquidurense]|uniref:Lipoprotein n=1 Tax=Flavobacterium aquidurense TaxID=362413 RepID=A0A0N8VLQ8_9FLAO|nr:hypothetical protein [Flavobacterium aquidurense]KQB37204.1 hypothetical protein RC62_2370 [Flavobacterium aquidurense]